MAKRSNNDSNFRDLLKSRLSKSMISLGDDPFADPFLINLLKTFYRMRQLPYFFKIFASCVTEQSMDVALSSDDLRCLENIFVDVGHTQALDIVTQLLGNFDQLVDAGTELDAETVVQFCTMLRSILFSCPSLLQTRTTAVKLIGEICERLKKAKKLESACRDTIRDILSEIVVKFYTASSAGGENGVDPIMVKAALPKKPFGLSWRVLLEASDQRGTTERFQRTIEKFISAGASHDCERSLDELGTPCLSNYCVVMEFWKTFMSNFALFRHCVSDDTTASVVQFILQRRASWKEDPFMAKCISDFLSVFDTDMDQMLVEERMDSHDAVSGDGVDALETMRSSVKSAITNGSKLDSLFGAAANDGPGNVRQLRMASMALESLESIKKVDDSVKTCLVDFSNRLLITLPALITDHSKMDVATTMETLAAALDVFAAMLADKALDLVKYPIVSVALTCASITRWERVTMDQRILFLQALKSFLKFLRVGMKKCKDLVIGVAPSWMGTLRRLQLVFFGLLASSATATVDDDDFTPLFFTLGRFYSSLERCRELEKVSAFMVYDLVECLKKHKVDQAQNDALLLGIYRLVKICDAFSISMITSMMDDASKELFRVIYDNYSKYYKYVGQT